MTTLLRVVPILLLTAHGVAHVPANVAIAGLSFLALRSGAFVSGVAQ